MATSGKQDIQGSPTSKSEQHSKQAEHGKNICEADAIQRPVFGHTAEKQESLLLAVERGHCKCNGNEKDDFFLVKSLDPLEEYNMNHQRRGLALIFNQEQFQWKNPRIGSSVDKKNLIEMFQKLNFDVRPYDNLEKEDVLGILDDAAKDNHPDVDCFVCVFMSHGEEDYIFVADDKIPIEDITDKFKGNNCRSLVGKPKIFIIQACRGQIGDNAVTPMAADDNDPETNRIEMEDGGVYTLPAGADFLMCYSVAKGYFSFRDPTNGSWYIQDLCEVLKRHGQSLEITELLTLVNRKVSMRIVNSLNRSLNNKKQVPCFSSMLTKKLYFRAKKQ